MSLSTPRKLTDTTVPNGPPQRKEVFYFAAAVAAGDVVVMDRATTTYGLGSAAKTSPATANFPEVLGVAEDAIVAATWGEVVTYGVVTVKAAADIDAGDAICTAATAGTVREAVNATDCNIFGFALEDDGAVTAGYCRVFVQKGG